MFEISEHRVLDYQVPVIGKLTAAGISKSQFGKSKLRVPELISRSSRPDDLKVAASDSLKKCGTLFGIGCIFLQRIAMATEMATTEAQ